jgi:hypothetical protein
MSMSQTDYLQLGLFALGVVCAVLGWFARQVWGAVQSLKEDVTNLRVMIGTDYVRFDRLAEALQPLLESLKDIKHSLRDKMDK